MGTRERGRGMREGGGGDDGGGMRIGGEKYRVREEGKDGGRA